MQKNFLSRRAQMALVGVGLWVLLALWSLSAFWSHIDSLGADYRLAAKCGAMAGEFALLALVLWHCFDRHLNVRRWSLILGFVLAGIILIHAGALRGMEDARTVQTAQVNDLSAKLTAMSTEQARAVTDSAASNAGSLKAQGISQKERLAISKGAQTQAVDTARTAQEQLAKQVMSVDDRVKATSILPDWYLNGWCYSLIFIVSLAFVGVIFLMMMSGEVDANFNGIPDRLEANGQRGNLYQFDERGNLVNAAEGITEEEARRHVGGKDPWPTSYHRRAEPETPVIEPKGDRSH